MEPLSGSVRVLMRVVSLSLLVALAATFASSVGWLPESVGGVTYWVAVVLTAGSGAVFLRSGSRARRVFGGFALVVAPAYASIQAFYDQPGHDMLLMSGPVSLVYLPSLVLLQGLAPLTAVICVVWGLIVSFG